MSLLPKSIYKFNAGPNSRKIFLRNTVNRFKNICVRLKTHNEIRMAKEGERFSVLDMIYLKPEFKKRKQSWYSTRTDKLIEGTE